ncbi:EAL domain-containing protein [Gordonia rhizosphera NBRC 16068]|uniref:EAL domain-containing protein n=1 Tax=Gordonia rhizosphera TaxID=83341 RepID=UPI003EE1B5DD
MAASQGRDRAERIAESYVSSMIDPVRNDVEVTQWSPFDWTIHVTRSDADRDSVIRVAAGASGTLPVSDRGRDYFLDVCVGLAVADDLRGATSTGELEQCAETALSDAITRDLPMVVADDALISRGRQAMDRFRRLVQSADTDFRLHYQPIVELDAHTVVGFEALLRWYSADGIKSAAEFMEEIEETSLILPIGRRVIASAIRDLATGINRTIGATGFVAVNLSERQLLDPGVVSLFRHEIDAAGVQPDRVWVEVRENQIISLDSDSARTVEGLHELGCRICVDDLGAGYSALRYVKDLPIDVLKVDGGLIRQMKSDEADFAVVRAICDLAHTTGIDTVAEGVECPEVLPVLIELGFDYAQGHYFGRPDPPEVVFAAPA